MIEDALFWFNHLHDFYSILALQLEFNVDLYEKSRLIMISGGLLMMLFLRTLCWLALRVCVVILINEHHNNIENKITYSR